MRRWASMGRPRSFEQRAVVVAAKEAFWERGYDATGIADLEAATGLSRSSLYLAFATKRKLFDHALAEYLDTFVADRLRPLETPGAGLREVEGYFTELARFFTEPGGHRGCLMINSIAELSGRDAFFEEGERFAVRLRAALSGALNHAARDGAMSRAQAARRGEMLTSAALGAWVAVRADPVAAAAGCRAIAAEVRSWAPARPRR